MNNRSRSWSGATTTGWLLLAQLLLWMSCASAGPVYVLASRSGGAYDEVVESLQAELGRSVDVKVQTLDKLPPEQVASNRWLLPHDTSVIVTVGVEAARAISRSADPAVPILCVLLPRISFESLLPGRDARRMSAVFLDSPAHRQLELIRGVLPAARNIGLVLGPASHREVEVIRQASTAKGLTLVTEVAQRESELYLALQTVIRSSDALLAFPDPQIINASTAQNVLLTSFRAQIPVFGYSVNYVQAGALAAVFSTPRQIGQEAGSLVLGVLRGGALPHPKFPRYFSVALNRPVAKSLGLSLPDEGVLLQRMQKIEGIE